MLHVICNSRKEEVQKQSPRHFSAVYSRLNCGITEIAERLATKRFMLHQHSARAGVQQAQTFFPSPVLPPPPPRPVCSHKTKPVLENYSPCPEPTSLFITSAQPKSHHAPGKDNRKSVLTLPAPPECRYYSSSLGTGPHM